MHPHFHHQDWFPRMLGNTVARGLGNKGGQDRPWGRGGCTLLIPTHSVMGREKRNHRTQPGVRECFLQEMVLELVGKDVWELESRRGSRQRGQHGSKRKCATCPCR